jgi:hypothetical protein
MGDNMSMFDVTPAAVNVSSLTESVLSGEMAATTAAGSAALVGVVPMAGSADDVALASAMAGAGGAYLGVAGAHVGQRSTYAAGQSMSSISYVLQELISAAQFSF